MEIKERIDYLVDLVNEANYNYHVLDNPTIEDVEYDKYLRELYTLEENTDVNKILKNNRYKIICINDSEEIEEKQFEYLKVSLINNLESIFPKKSSFEK